MTTPSDDECIALALLHGCEFYDAFDDHSEWFVHGDSENLHPIEERRQGNDPDGFLHGWPSRAALAREYCEYHKLFGDPHDHSTQLRSGHAA